jgi:hypothetical protein
MQQAMKTMKLLAAPLMLSLALAAIPTAAQADGRRGDHRSAFDALREGKVKSLREIEGRIVPQMAIRGANYIGPEFDPGTAVYRLKFMRGSRVIWLDVDGRTGAVIGHSGR